jgi:hypothetical protein
MREHPQKLSRSDAIPTGELPVADSQRPILASRTSRREVLASLAGLGIGTAVFQRALAAEAEKGSVTTEMIQQAEWIAGIELTDEERNAAAKEIEGDLKKYEALRQAAVGYDVPPALTFYPVPPQTSGGTG